MRICKFCNQERKLIEAHIIPLSFYRPLMAGGVPRLHSIKGTPKTSRRFPRGAVDSNLVCEECEARFSSYDDYAKTFFIDDFEKNYQDLPELQGKWIICTNFDYPRLKLFFISLLWRASASNIPLFGRVRVGPFEARLKEMIINSDPGQPDEFSVMLRKFKEDWADKGIIQPTKFRDENKINCYHFFLGRFSARIKVSNQPYPDHYAPVILNTKPPLAIAQQDLIDCFEYKKFMAEYSKNFDAM